MHTTPLPQLVPSGRNPPSAWQYGFCVGVKHEIRPVRQGAATHGPGSQRVSESAPSGGEPPSHDAAQSAATAATARIAPSVRCTSPATPSCLQEHLEVDPRGRLRGRPVPLLPRRDPVGLESAAASAPGRE